jgi:hypothetical protein
MVVKRAARADITLGIPETRADEAADAGSTRFSGAAHSLRRLSTNAVSSARALSLSASSHLESAARSQTPSIIAAIIAARRAYELEPLPHPLGDAPRQRSEGGFEQALLVAEIMRHQPRGDIGALRDLRQRAADVSHLRQTVDRDFDKLPPTHLFGLVTHTGAFLRIVATGA